MVLRVYKNNKCIGTWIDINRLRYNVLGRLEFRYYKDNAFQWKTFEAGKDYGSFKLDRD